MGKLIAVIDEPAVIEKILKHIGLDPQPPPRAKAQRVELLEQREVRYRTVFTAAEGGSGL